MNVSLITARRTLQEPPRPPNDATIVQLESLFPSFPTSLTRSATSGYFQLHQYRKPKSSDFGFFVVVQEACLLPGLGAAPQ